MIIQLNFISHIISIIQVNLAHGTYSCHVTYSYCYPYSISNSCFGKKILSQYLLSIFLSQQFSALIYDAKVEFNPEFGNTSISCKNDDIHDTVTNFTIVLYKPITNVFAYIEIRSRESEDDKVYKRIYFQSTIDVAKILKGVRGNFVISYFSDMVLKSLDFELKFPLPNGTYSGNNLIFPGHLIPIKDARFLAIIKYFIKLQGRKSRVLFNTITAYARSI